MKNKTLRIADFYGKGIVDLNNDNSIWDIDPTDILNENNTFKFVNFIESVNVDLEKIKKMFIEYSRKYIGNQIATFNKEYKENLWTFAEFREIEKELFQDLEKIITKIENYNEN